MPIRVVYSDVDGTLVGPGGSFFETADRQRTLEPAKALVDLLDARMALVLVSGRTRVQLLNACFVLGADGFIGEMGAVVSWDRGRQAELLAGDMPSSYSGTPYDVLHETGVVDKLLARHRRRLTYHAPWHLGHEADVMLRGRVDVDDVEGWLRDEGYGWVRLLDNGVLPARADSELDDDVLPPHVYHLMPGGISKGRGVQADLARRGLSAADAIAVGDSLSDLDMAPYVNRMFLTANALWHPEVEAAARGLDNVEVVEGVMGIGWAQAVRWALSVG